MPAPSASPRGVGWATCPPPLPVRRPAPCHQHPDAQASPLPVTCCAVQTPHDTASDASATATPARQGGPSDPEDPAQCARCRHGTASLVDSSPARREMRMPLVQLQHGEQRRLRRYDRGDVCLPITGWRWAGGWSWADIWTHRWLQSGSISAPDLLSACCNTLISAAQGGEQGESIRHCRTAAAARQRG